MKHQGPNPSGLCLCGCGRKTSIAKANNIRYGYIKGQPHNFIQNHKPTGERSFNWKGGRVDDHSAYVRVRIPGRYIREHVFLAEKALGKALPPKAVVHHHTPDQIVLCQDTTYHHLLHKRQRALKACGHAGWRKCWVCQTYDDPSKIKDYGRSPYHQACLKKHKELKRHLTSQRTRPNGP